MRLRDFFILEGEQDSVNRQKAMTSANFLIKSLSGISPKYVTTSPNGIEAIYKGKDLNPPDNVAEVISNMSIHFVAIWKQSPKTGASFQYKKNASPSGVLTIWCDEGTQNNIGDATSWRQYVSANASKMLTRRYSMIIHELTHAIDLPRVKDPAYAEKGGAYDSQKLYNKDPGEIRKYMRDPIEMNAVLQQYLHGVELRLAKNKVKSMKDVKNFIGANNPQEFSKKIWDDYLPREFTGAMNKEKTKHVQKRIYQFWKDLENKFPP